MATAPPPSPPSREVGAGLCCLLTVHGVGFQQAPGPGVPGYADALHLALAERLGPWLSDDPRRAPHQIGPTVPVYVTSQWPPEDGSPEAGLARLGRLRARGRIETEGAELARPGARIAHVALVYAGLAGRGPDLPSLLETAELALPSIGRYATLRGISRLIFQDAAALLHPGEPSATSSLRVRRDSPRPTGEGSASILRQIEDDVGAYVIRNDVRERVRGFVREALLRLLLRPDVSRVVVNAHSQGTVVAFDVLRTIEPDRTVKLGALVTAGSPLRKFVVLLGWGSEVGSIRLLPRWLNFWDPDDPIADPLSPPRSWRRGEPLPQTSGLFQALDPDTGRLAPMAVQDLAVDNRGHVAATALRVHDYWDNREQFVAPLADLLMEQLASTEETTTSGPDPG
ncbi:MAG TPA: hypothetical protein VFD01_08855 [Candidatus Dormibacteraeota bacterium]|jgi:hypothetical protein|nr:hypothetical protein [Candidatus Dormibacteraeota bacterium]